MALHFTSEGRWSYLHWIPHGLDTDQSCRLNCCVLIYPDNLRNCSWKYRKLHQFYTSKYVYMSWGVLALHMWKKTFEAFLLYEDWFIASIEVTWANVGWGWRLQVWIPKKNNNNGCGGRKYQTLEHEASLAAASMTHPNLRLNCQRFSCIVGNASFDEEE